jgi:hypothetical protein
MCFERGSHLLGNCTGQDSLGNGHPHNELICLCDTDYCNGADAVTKPQALLWCIFLVLAAIGTLNCLTNQT